MPFVKSRKIEMPDRALSERNAPTYRNKDPFLKSRVPPVPFQSRPANQLFESFCRKAPGEETHYGQILDFIKPLAKTIPCREILGGKREGGPAQCRIF